MSGHTANEKGGSPCAKQRYDDKKSALTALNAALRRRHNRPDGLRAYFCAWCRAWHLTKSSPAKVSAADASAGTRVHVRAQLAGSVSLPGTEGAVSNIQWMPPGRNQIVAFVDDVPTELEVDVTPEMARKVESAFAELMARFNRGEGDEPFIDFNHKNHEAAGHPSRLYWGGDDPKNGGIRAVTALTADATAAVRQKKFTRFSPTWLMDPVTGEFLGLDTNLGGLVNKAAFQKIQTVSASGGGLNPKTPMTDAEKNELKTIVADATKPLADRLATLEAKASAAPAAGAATVSASDAKITDLENRLKAVETTTKTATAAQAKAAVQVHARRGAIPAQDAETVTFWEAQYQANPDQAEKVLAKLPDNPALAKVTQASGAGAGAAAVVLPDTAEEFVATVKASQAAGKAKGVALQEAISAKPKAYAAWRAADGKHPL